MTKQYYYRAMFIVSALFNCLLAGSALIMQTGALVSSNTDLPQGWQFPMGYLYFVLVFGIGYYLVSRDLNSNHGIVILGILGKIGVFLIFLADYLWGSNALPQTLIGGVDLLFAFLFIEFLHSYKENKNVAVN
jgi:hypothetical protein